MYAWVDLHILDLPEEKPLAWKYFFGLQFSSSQTLVMLTGDAQPPEDCTFPYLSPWLLLKFKLEVRKTSQLVSPPPQINGVLS